MKLLYLTSSIIDINAAIDTGKYQDISVEEVEEHIEKGDLIPYLKERIGKDIDLSYFEYKYDPKKAEEIKNRLKHMLDSYAGYEYRKWGVKNSGLCLLVAWVAEIIQWKMGKSLLPE